MTSHHDLRAGTSGAESVYSTAMAMPSVSRTGVTTNKPSHRRSRLNDSTRKVREIPRALVSENSYMLPHGTRPADRPRAMTAPRSSRAPSHITDMATLPARRPGSRPSAGAVRSRVATAPGSEPAAD
ncbi:unannotated protein [freshwater metagenome]|uniref:Unannotated protein n=1 Tax=freshwater metagenome TaxID=449393 RepID=A0A6J7QE97_9ZZZZ